MTATKPLISQAIFSRRLLQWHAQYGRHDLPWKKQINAYRVWVSEIMLQQTQVATVIPYFKKFIKSFPSLTHLAKAPLEKVLAHWSGLGYYARARNLHRAAQQIQTQWQGQFPQQLEEILTLPGIGRSTAGAILAQAFGIRAPILDGNVKRVLSRFHCLGEIDKKEVEQQLWQLADYYTPHKHVADYTQAMMDLGATLCTRSKPQCRDCPLQTHCLAFQRQQQHLFPSKKKRKALPVRQVYLLCLWGPQRQLLLQKRPPRGIWGSLWSLPEFTSLAETQEFLHLLGYKKANVETQSLLRHTFTHFHLDITPLTVHLTRAPASLQDPSLAWIKTSALTKRGLPAPIKKIIKTTLEIA